MKYEIQEKHDLSGALLLVKIPEDAVDQKALYTIQAEQPEFLLPFHYRSFDGKLELSYQLGNCSKLQYRYSRRTPEAYIDLWEQLLRPLLDCQDWFLSPLSFVMDTQYLYTDKSGTVIKYVYIPSLEPCSEFGNLNSMAMTISQNNPVTDMALENQVLKALMQDFRPKAFLEMLHKSVTKAAPVEKKLENVSAAPIVEMPKVKEPQPIKQVVNEKPALEKNEKPSLEAPVLGDGDIVINLGGDGKEKPKKEKSKGLFGSKKEKEPKEPKKEPKQKEKKKKHSDKEDKEIILGARDVILTPVTPPPAMQYDAPPIVNNNSSDTGMEETVLEGEGSGTCLRYVGTKGLPPQITVVLERGQSFSIGRFDVSVGHAQSNFEFPKDTKAVSRHHAAIERQSDGNYVIIDLNSSAGTFVDGQRLTPGVAWPLRSSSKVSFGTSGADYIWEEF